MFDVNQDSRSNVVDCSGFAKKYNLPEKDLERVLKRAREEPPARLPKRDDKLSRIFAHVEAAILLLGDEYSEERRRIAQWNADDNLIPLEEAVAQLNKDVEGLSNLFVALMIPENDSGPQGDTKIRHAVSLLARFWHEQTGSIPKRVFHEGEPGADLGTQFLCDAVECYVLPDVRDFDSSGTRFGFRDIDEARAAEIRQIRSRIETQLKRVGRRLRHSCGAQ